MLLPDYHENLSTLHVGTLPNHAYFIPHSSRESALSLRRTQSTRFVPLNGEWGFTFYHSVLDLPEDFLSAADEATMPVPAVWQYHGYDTQQYTNKLYPFPFDIPHVPVDNPCGAYTRHFTCSKQVDKRYTLCFEGVDSCAYVWLNGCFVGYSQVSHCTSEYDVTDKVQNGDNVLKVLVLKWCDGSYWEDQDKFRHTGIFRDVYLLVRDGEHLSDYTIRTLVSEDLQTAEVRLMADRPLQCELLDADNHVLKPLTALEENVYHCTMDHPHLWSAESPYLYRLLIHCGDEWIVEEVGVRTICVKNGVVLLNGQNVKFRGVNRHDSDPFVGPAVGEKEMTRDLLVMKQHNVNAIRTSHYPNAPEFLHLCDRYGFYLIDEADIECHGVVSCYGGNRGDYDLLANDPAYTDVFMDRVQRCVIRDKNRPCVVMWSMGNEAGHGVCMNECLAWTKQYDPTRLTHYERASYPPPGQTFNQQDLDTYSRMYASVEAIDQYFAQMERGRELEGGVNCDYIAPGIINKPYVLCEYCHAMGNSPGDLEDYFQCIERHPGHCGAFVWEWCDHAVYSGQAENGKDRFLYGGDFGEFPNDGNFCMDGLVYPDRRPHTGLLEFKNVMRPARIRAVDLPRGHFEVWNLYDFTTLADAVEIRYTLLQNGQTIGTGKVEQAQLNILPHQRATITVDDPALQAEQVAIRFETFTLHDGYALPKGHCVGVEQLGRQCYSPAMPTMQGGSVSVQEDARCITIRSDRFCYRYDKQKVHFSHMTYADRPLLDRPMHFNIWRAPADNDRRIRNQWQAYGFDRAIPRGYETTVSTEGDVCVLTTRFAIGAVYIRNLVEGTVVWRIAPDGAVTVQVAADVREDLPFLPRFGLRLFLPGSMDQVSYFGYGPCESYVDKHQASCQGLYHSPVAAMHEDYLKPQENGSHWDCSFVQVRDAGMRLSVTGESFSFHASPYTQEELAGKAHAFELEACGSTVLCIDAMMAGMGSNSCGPELGQAYRPGNRIDFCCTLTPERLQVQ